MTGNNRIRGWTAFLLAGCVLGLALGFFLSPKQTFSENENRYLASWPELTWDNVKSGQFMTGVSDYLSDHFPGRDWFMGLKSRAEILEGRKEINGVYIAEDGYLIEAYRQPENTERIAGILREFKETLEGMESSRDGGWNLHLMLVPTASYILKDKLPARAPMYSQMDTMKELWELTGIPAIDCSETLAEYAQKGQIYYRTDHHWTTFGAYAGYLAYCRALGLTPVKLEELKADTVTEDFRGTVYSKVNDYSHPGDAITVYTNEADRLTVSYTDTGEESDSLYNLDYVEQKDKYSLFLDNLHSLIEITNETAESDRELVLLKDSYANSLVPFLTRHYRKIYVFDTRSYRMGPSAFIAEHPGVSDILILYNMNTLDTDLGIRAIY